jgi:WD40 repeat protein
MDKRLKLDAQHPWPGLATFGEGDQDYFRGRRRESDELTRLVRRERLTVLFGRSGLGKSSLLHAGLFPRLREDLHLPVYLRIDYAVATSPRQQVLDALNETCIRHGVKAMPPEPDESLWAYFHRFGAGFWSPRRRPLLPVLVFDQFEEIFTLGQMDDSSRGAAEAFIEELADLIEDRPSESLREQLDADPALGEQIDFDRRGCKVLLSFREDFLADVEGLHGRMPSLMRNRFRLLPMDGAQALDVIGSGSDIVGAEVADRIVGLAWRNRSEAPLPEEFGRVEVDPALLSVICSELNLRRLAIGTATIGSDLLAGAEREILVDFFERSLQGLDPSVRHFVEDELITATGFRDSRALDDALARPGITSEALDKLVAGRLLGMDERFGVRRLELTHDVLTRVVMDSRDKRHEREARERAEREREQAHRAVQKTERRLRKSQRITIAMTAVGIIAIVASLIAVIEWTSANALYKQAKADNFAFISSKLLKDGDLTRALRVAQVAYEIDPANVPSSVKQVLSDSYRDAAAEHKAFYKNNLRHNDVVTAAIYSPDGSKIVTASKDGTAKLWDANGKLIREMQHTNEKGAPEHIQHAAFTHDGKKIITVGYGRLVKMWDAEGRYIKDLTGHGSQPFSNVNKVAIAPDDQTIVTVSSDQNVIMWNNQGEKIKVLDEHSRLNGWVNTVAFSPDGRYFATAGGDRDRSVQLYDVRGRHIASLGKDQCTEKKSWNCGIFDIAFSPDGDFLLTASADKTIKMYDLNGNHLKTLTNHSARVNSVTFSPDGQSFLSASNDKTAILWNNDGKVIEVFKGHEEAVTSALFCPNGSCVATSSGDKTAKLWDLEGNVLATYGGHKAGIGSLTFSPDGNNLVTASDDKTALLWKVQPLQFPVLKHQGEVVVARFLPDGKRILTASNDMTVRLWNADTTGLFKTYAKVFGPGRLGNTRIYSLDISPDGERFVTTGTDYTVRIWQVESGKVIKEWIEGRNQCSPTDWCGAINARYAPDGQHIVTSDYAGMVKIFDSHGTFLRRVQAHEDEVNGIAISLDNKRMLTGSNDSTIKLWDFESLELQKTFSDHTRAVRSVTFSDKGDQILSGSDDQTVKLWDLQGNILLTIEAHANEVRSVEFSQDMKKILTSSADNTAKIWDMKGQLLRLLSGHQKYLRSAYFSPKGDKIVTASGDQFALIWPSTESIYTWLRDSDIYRLTSEDRQELSVNYE